MPKDTGQMTLHQAASGYQRYIQGTAAAGATPVPAYLDANTRLIDQSLAASSTYYFFIPTAGALNADISLTATFTNAPTITAYPCAADGISQKPGSTATSITLTSGTASLTTVQNLRGERGVILKIVTGAGTTTFATAEYSAL